MFYKRRLCIDVLLFVLLVTYDTAVLAQALPTKSINDFAPQAKTLFERITGVKVPLIDSRVQAMAERLLKNDLEGAVSIPIKDPLFTNVKARNLALRLTNKSNSVNVDFNDTAALILGIIRDNTDFREIFTAPYYYDVASAASYGNPNSFYFTNSLIEADTNFLDLNAGLVKIANQRIPLSVGVGQITKINAEFNAKKTDAQERNKKMHAVLLTAQQPDPAGVLTTQGFAKTQYSGGTNRRPVEFVVKNFLCSSMPEIGDASASDAYVGKDVDRFFGGSYSNYTNNCKSCHTVMDGFRGAFAKVNYNNFYGAALSGRQSMAHGSFSKNTNPSHQKWLNDVINYGTLKTELEAKGQMSTLYKNLSTALVRDYTLATKSFVPSAPVTFAEAQDLEIFRNQVSMLAPEQLNTQYMAFIKANPTVNPQELDARIALGHINDMTNNPIKPGSASDLFLKFVTAKMPAAWSFYKKEAYVYAIKNFKAVKGTAVYLSVETNKTLVGTPFSSVLPTLAAVGSPLRSSILKDSSAAGKVVDANVNNNWLAANSFIIYFRSTADLILSKNVSEIVESNKINFDYIYANKNNANIKNEYGPNCVGLASVKTASSFFQCELEYKKEKSILASYILSKMSANKAPAEVIQGVTYFFNTNPTPIFPNAYIGFRRGAWYAYLQSIDNYYEHASGGFDVNTEVANKMTGGADPNGYTITDDSFVNLASDSYGWRGPYASGGSGLNQFGHMIADSKAFSSCMTQKVYTSLCIQPQAPAAGASTAEKISFAKQSAELKTSLKKWTFQFESSGYKIKDLYKQMSMDPNCNLMRSYEISQIIDGSTSNLVNKNAKGAK